MKRVVFSTVHTSFTNLQPLQNELKNVGIQSFDVDFENKEISMTCPSSLNINVVECAIKKAGFKCPCFRVYDSSTD